MSFLMNVWYQAGWFSDLADGNILARTILNTPLLFFRDNDGTPSAVLDRCPHRFAPLSAGKVEKGVVTCGYHGLAFDGVGRCVHNPHGKISESMRVPSFRAVERHEVLWIWMGDQKKADTDLIPDLSFIDTTPERARIKGLIPTRANYQLIVDNLMDLSHSDYLHPTTLGGMMKDAITKVRSEGDQIVVEYFSENCEPPPAFQSIVPPPLRADIRFEVRWFAAGVIVLIAGANRTGIRRKPEEDTYTLHSMTPETNSTSHYFYCSTRPFRTDDEHLSAFLKSALEKAFIDEDKPMLEAQQTRIGDADFWTLKPLLLPVDGAAVQVRRKFSKMLDVEAERRA